MAAITEVATGKSSDCHSQMLQSERDTARQAAREMLTYLRIARQCNAAYDDVVRLVEEKYGDWLKGEKA